MSIFYAPIFFSSANKEFCVCDIETTGLNEECNEILEFGALLVRDCKIVSEFNTLVKPSIPITEEITKINGITNEMVKDAPRIREALQNFLYFVGKRLILGHNWNGFDNKWIRANSQFWFGQSFWNRTIDSLALAKKVFVKRDEKKCPYPKDETHPDGYDIEDHKLQTLAKHFNIDPGEAHRAVDDAYTALLVFIELEKLFLPHFADEITKAFKDICEFKNPKPSEVIF
jgi:DNA polymerase III epsilon subunit-like protein